VSKLYRIGYNALAVLALPLLLPSLDPLSRQAFKTLGFVRIQFLRCFCFYSFIIEQKHLLLYVITALDNLPFSGIPD